MQESFGHIFDESLDNIKVVSNCPVCNTKYYSADAKILEERENGHLVHIQCKKCKSNVIALILASGVGISSVSLVTDLTSDDVLKFKDQNPISFDTVIELHNALSRDKDININKL